MCNRFAQQCCCPLLALGHSAPFQVYAFSVENWQRDAAEVSFLMDLFRSSLLQQLPELQSNGVRLQFMGQLHRLPPALQQQCRACEAATAGNSGLLLTVAVSYSAQEDMAQAMQQLAQAVQAGQIQPQEVRTGPDWVGNGGQIATK